MLKQEESMGSMLRQWAMAVGALLFLIVCGPPVMLVIGVMRVLEPAETRLRLWWRS